MSMQIDRAKAKVKIISAFGPKIKVNLERMVDKNGKPVGSRTQRQFRDECDINLIMAKYNKGHAIDHFTRRNASYGFASGLSFTESMNLVIQAQNMFEDLPSNIRKKFANSPAEFLDFVQDESNADEMVELGLREAPSPVDKQKPIGDPQGGLTAEELTETRRIIAEKAAKLAESGQSST